MSGSLPKQICTDCFISVEKLFKFSESCIETHTELKNKASEQQLGESIIARSDEAEDKPGLVLSCDFTQELITSSCCSGTDCSLCGDGKLTLTSLAFPDRVPLPLSDPVISVKSINSINETFSPPTKIKEEKLNDSWEAADNAFNYYCNRCSADFKSFSDLLPHSLMHSEDGNYVCVLCDFVGERKTDLTSHFKTHDVEPAIYQCDNCGIGFRSLSLFEIHNCITNNCSLNRCNVCHKTFRSESRLEFHKKFHDSDNKPGQCEYCPKSFSDEMKLYKHVTYLHSDKKSNKNISCEECGKSFRSLSSLKYHLRVHLGEPLSVRPFSCDICSKSFSRRSMLRNHISVFHKTLSQETDCFMCGLCYEIFPFSDSACFHLEKAHPLNSEATYQSINSKVLVCEFCKRCFPSSTYINNHRSRHKNDTPYECKHCGYEFETDKQMESHVQSEHTEAVSKEYLCEFNMPPLYSCEYCDRDFISLVKYTEHQTIHYGNTPYMCRLCDLKFPSLEDCYSHKLTQHPEESDSNKTNYYRPFDCHYCNKSFAIEDALVKHIRMHTGEKPFICDVCGKAFSQSSGLYTHQKVHSTDRPYSCTLCPRKFKIKGDRDIHVRKHSGERPYKCEFCGKAFMTQHVYSQHRKIHTGERPYKCDVCHISFRRSHVLTVHKRIHTGEKPNICDICGKSYRQKGDMLKHKRIQHGYIHRSKQSQMFY